MASSQCSANAPCSPPDDWPPYTDVSVAPVVRVVRVPGPLLRDPDTAGHGDLPIGDEHPAVRAVREPAQRVRTDRPEAADLDARIRHPPHLPAVHHG